MLNEYSDHDAASTPSDDAPTPLSEDLHLTPSPGGRQPYQTPPSQTPPPRQAVRVRMPDSQPIFTYLLLGLIVLVWLASQVIPVTPEVVVVAGQRYGIQTGEDLFLVYGAKINDAILREGEFYRLITMMFLHGNLAHLFFNGYALWVIGQGLERLYGHTRFLIVYFVGGLTASVASVVFTAGISVGASGALFAIFGAEMIFLFRHHQLYGEAGRRRLNNLVMLLLVNLTIGLLGSGLIDNWAHAGGFVGGTALAWLIGPRFRLEADPGEPGVVQLADQNPTYRWVFAPVLWLAGLAVILAALATGQG